MTVRQLQLLDFIQNTIAHTGKWPTFSEMKKHMSVTSNQTVQGWIGILEREGHIQRDKKGKRVVKITPKIISAIGGENMAPSMPKVAEVNQSRSTGFAVSYSTTSSPVIMSPAINRFGSVFLKGGKANGTV